MKDLNSINMHYIKYYFNSKISRMLRKILYKVFRFIACLSCMKTVYIIKDTFSLKKWKISICASKIFPKNAKELWYIYHPKHWLLWNVLISQLYHDQRFNFCQLNCFFSKPYKRFPQQTTTKEQNKTGY